ncbi:hypothetical protein Micbo1qcDRAFT_19387 [Microdochium bolleyi]|uniref:Protein kinase domain-containing protein n=1 Tax=Microdochium bolleyi TaxID=196109 RepID=A0A136ITN6_9PEZI|nr:hypothetical protein Micbo1qcDRAFT_19387 [Microdochium bolleyi]
MVLSDMGLTALHSEYSRSRQPAAMLAMTPTYRPPESDLEGNVISRSYDIWTLGCLFMETMIWHLDGFEWLFQFSQERLTSDVTGCKKPTYFDIKEFKGASVGAAAHTASIKVEVLKYFEKIRNHPKCTQFVLDVIEIVQDEMIIVRRANNDRITSSRLEAKIASIHSRCQRSDSYVCNTANAPRGISDPVHVEVVLGQHVLDNMRMANFRLQAHVGKTEKSISREELART